MAAITFLMGDDANMPGNPFYANARGFFGGAGPDVIEKSGGLTLEDVFKTLRDRAGQTPPKIYDPIKIVSHATGFSSFEFKLRAGASDITSADDLTAEVLKINNKAAGAWQQLGPPIIVPATNVVIYGCDVGRDAQFLENFGRLFGEDLNVSAPLRVAVFRHSGATFEYRLARTWSVPWPSDITEPANWTPAAKATATRQAFVAAADLKFGARWILVKDVVGPTLASTLTTVAQNATLKIADAWFFGEQIVLEPVDEQNPQADINRMVPSKSAIITPGGSEVDDTTVANVVGPAQVTHKLGPKKWAAEIAGLAQVINQPVNTGAPDQYRKVTIASPKAPSAGPKPPPNTPPVPPPAHSNLWGQARDELIAAGVPDAELDALIAEIAPAEAPDLALPDPDTTAIEGLDREPTAEDFA